MRLIALIGLFGLVIQVANGIELASDGGYSFVVAVDKDAAQPANVDQYIGSLKRSLQEFSNNLFATTERFHVKSVDILIPDTWTVADALDADITASYQTSEVRLSDQIKYASVDNPNPCGLAGDHISLPFTFFNGNDGQYGVAWKALLTLWARYRWGVWEEHGHASSSRYPYFSKPEANSRDWATTGCSNEQLAGRFLDQHGDVCDIDPAVRPNEDCRFHPNLQSNATTSLMHFHWLDSVTRFCDESTHNLFAPNRQNLLCNQKSVLEIVSQSSDYQLVTGPPTDPVEIELIQFRTLKPNTTPYLYFILDKARPGADLSVVNAAIHGLAKFFQPEELPNAIAGLGTFPPLKPIDGATLNAEITFTQLESNLDQFIVKLGELKTDGDEIRDFASPIIEATRLIRTKRPVGGGVIFFLKIGGTELTPNMPFEEEIAAMLRREQITLISLELGSEHLANLLEKSGGIFRSVNSLAEVDETIEELLTLLKAELTKKVDAPAENVEILFSGPVTVGDAIDVQIPEHVTSVETHLILPSTNAGTAMIVVSGNNQNYTRSMDWSVDLISSATARNLLTVIPPLDANDDPVWSFSYICAGSGCTTSLGHFLIYGVSDRSASISRKGLLAADDDIQITISTSAQDNVVDFARTFDTLSPFAIYAKITQGEIPVRNLLVRAYLEDQEDDTIHELTLLDNGFGTPDVDKLDGIYSGNFIPAKDGILKVYVAAESPRDRKGLQVHGTSLSQRLLPVDQREDERESIELGENFLQSAELEDAISVMNVDSIPSEFADRPFRILDLNGQPSEEGIVVTFTVPQTPRNTVPENLRYDVLASTSSDSFTEVILAEQEGEAVPESPESRTIAIARALYGEQAFLVIRSKNELITSELSNIIKIGEEEIEDPTTTTTTTEPTTTTTTGPTTTTTTEPTTTTTTEPTTTTTTGPTTTTTTGPTTTTTTGPTTTTTTEPTTTTTTEPTTTTTTEPTTTTTTEPTTTTGAPPGDDDDDDKSFFSKAGGIVVIILIVLIVLGAAGGGVYFYLKRRNQASDFGKLIAETPATYTTTEPSESNRTVA